jgi:hypothetical protein
MAHDAAMGRARRVRSRRSPRTQSTHGGALAGGPVVLDRRV